MCGIAGYVLRALLDDATRLRLRADVPAAVQISGGMDSSAVLALVANHAKRISAFTVKFPDPRHDEEPYARAVAHRYRDQVDYHVFEPPDDDLLEHGFPFPIGPWLLRHEQRLVAMIAGLDCPYLDPRVLASEWQVTARRDPNRMWALVSLALWWKKCIQGDRLAA